MIALTSSHSGLVGGEAVHEGARVADDDREDVVEVVGDAPGEAPDRLQALRDADAPLQLAALLLGDAPLGDVAGDAHEALRRAVVALDEVHAVGDPALDPVAADDAVLDRLIDRAVAGGEFLRQREEAIALIGGDDVEPHHVGLIREHLLRGDAVDALKARAGVDEVTGGEVEAPEHLLDRFGQLAEALLGLLALLLPGMELLKAVDPLERHGGQRAGHLQQPLLPWPRQALKRRADRERPEHVAVHARDRVGPAGGDVQRLDVIAELRPAWVTRDVGDVLRAPGLHRRGARAAAGPDRGDGDQLSEGDGEARPGEERQLALALSPPHDGALGARELLLDQEADRVEPLQRVVAPRDRLQRAGLEAEALGHPLALGDVGEDADQRGPGTDLEHGGLDRQQPALLTAARGECDTAFCRCVGGAPAAPDHHISEKEPGL